MAQSFGKSLAVSYKVKSAVQLQGVYLREIKRYVHKKLIQMITAAFVIIAPKWKQPRYPSTGK